MPNRSLPEHLIERNANDNHKENLATEEPSIVRHPWRKDKVVDEGKAATMVSTVTSSSSASSEHRGIGEQMQSVLELTEALKDMCIGQQIALPEPLQSLITKVENMASKTQKTETATYHALITKLGKVSKAKNAKEEQMAKAQEQWKQYLQEMQAQFVKLETKHRERLVQYQTEIQELAAKEQEAKNEINEYNAKIMQQKGTGPVTNSVIEVEDDDMELVSDTQYASMLQGALAQATQMAQNLQMPAEKQQEEEHHEDLSQPSMSTNGRERTPRRSRDQEHAKLQEDKKEQLFQRGKIDKETT